MTKWQFLSLVTVDSCHEYMHANNLLSHSHTLRTSHSHNSVIDMENVNIGRALAHAYTTTSHSLAFR